MKSCSSVPSIWDALTIFWAGLELCRSRSSLPPRLRPAHFTAVAALGGLPMVQSSPKFWCLCCTFTNILPWAIFGYSDHVPWFQAPSSLRGPFIPGASPAPEGVPTPVVSPGLSQCQSPTGLHGPFMPPKLVPCKKLFLSPTASAEHRV